MSITAPNQGLVHPAQASLEAFVDQYHQTPGIQSYEELQDALRGESNVPRLISSFIIHKAGGNMTPWGTSLIVGSVDKQHIEAELQYHDEMPEAVNVELFKKRHVPLLRPARIMGLRMVIDDPTWDIATIAKENPGFFMPSNSSPRAIEFLGGKVGDRTVYKSSGDSTGLDMAREASTKATSVFNGFLDITAQLVEKLVRAEYK